MNDETFQQLLRNADRDPAASPSPTAEALLAAALRRRRRTAGSRAAMATLAVGAVVLAGAWMATRNGREIAAKTVKTVSSKLPGDAAPSEAIPRPATTADLARELAVLESEAAWRGQVVAALAASVGAPAADDDEFAAPTMSDAEWVRIEAARSAALSWQYANLVEHEFHDAQAARREYERLVARFPGTAWAELATVSLERLLTSEKTPL